MIKKLNGRLRLLFNACPLCNSDAPEVDDCVVCNRGKETYPPTEIIKAGWWCRFLQVLEFDKNV